MSRYENSRVTCLGYLSKWNSTFFFAFSLIIEGTTEMLLQLIMWLKSIYNKNLGFTDQKCIFEHWEVQTRKTLLIDIIFVTIKTSDDLFRVAPYRLMSVLHKDALFHCVVLPKDAMASRGSESQLQTMPVPIYNRLHT